MSRAEQYLANTRAHHRAAWTNSREPQAKEQAMLAMHHASRAAEAAAKSDQPSDWQAAKRAAILAADAMQAIQAA